MPVNTITEIVTKNSDIINNILISSIGSGVRYLNDVRNGKEIFKLKIWILTIIIGGSIGYGLYGIISEFLGVESPALISSISFVIGLLGREVINVLIDVAPNVLKNFLNRWNFPQNSINVGNFPQNSIEKTEDFKKSPDNNLPDA